MKYLEELRRETHIALSKFKTSSRTLHAPTTGDEREDIVKFLVRPFLAKCYGLNAGMAFATLNEKHVESRQLDLVIHDDVFSTAIPLGNTGRYLFPCESVYGCIEVKSRLDSEGLKTAVKNVESLKVLSREPTDMLDITPLARIRFDESISWDTSPTNPYLGCVFALDGMPANKVLDFLHDTVHNLEVPPTLLPTLIVNVKKQYVVSRYKDVIGGTKTLLTPSDEYDGFLAQDDNNDNEGNDALPLFILLLSTFLRSVRLRQPQWDMIMVGLMKQKSTQQNPTLFRPLPGKHAPPYLLTRDAPQ